MSKNLLFDFDGTLIDSSDSILASFAAAVAQCGRQPAVALERSLIGPPLRDTMRRISGCEDEAELHRLVEAFKDAYDTHGYRETRVYPGIGPALAKLHAAGAALFIVTNKRILPTTRILAHLGWEPLFSGVFALDGTTPHTANKTALVAHVLARGNIAAGQATMIGDTPEDLAAATRNGLRFAAARWGYGHFEPGMLETTVRLDAPDDIGRL